MTKASANCTKALGLASQSEGYTCAGNVSFGTGKYQKAVEQFERAVELDPNSDYALGYLADAYQKVGKPEAAEAAYKKAISLRPNYWAVYNWLGAFYVGEARYSEAADMFRKVIELAPDNYRGYSNLGGVYQFEGRYSNSITTLKRSIELRPSTDAYSNLGAAYFYSHQFPQAVENFREAAKLNDQDWLNWGNLGDALYWNPGHREEASAAYRTAITLARKKLEVNPKDANILAYIAVYSAMLEDRQQASADLHKALALAPTDPDVMFRAALVNNRNGDANQTIEWLKKSMDAGYSPTTVRDTPDFDHLNDNPRFRALLGK